MLAPHVAVKKDIMIFILPPMTQFAKFVTIPAIIVLAQGLQHVHSATQPRPIIDRLLLPIIHVLVSRAISTTLYYFAKFVISPVLSVLILKQTNAQSAIQLHILEF